MDPLCGSRTIADSYQQAKQAHNVSRHPRTRRCASWICGVAIILSWPRCRYLPSCCDFCAVMPRSRKTLWELRGRTLELLQSAALLAVAEVPAQVAGRSCDYNWNVSTQENYATASQERDSRLSADTRLAHNLRHVDLAYHGGYIKSRQILHHALVRALVHDSSMRSSSVVQTRHVIFTAGAIGAGKSFTSRWLAEQGLLPSLLEAVYIDPDVIARSLPEWDEYQAQAGRNESLSGHAMCLREAGLVAELALWAALDANLSLCVDSSMQNGEWHRSLFSSIRRDFPQHKLLLLHTEVGDAHGEASEVLHQRAQARAERTGRHVPKATIAASAHLVPRSVALLCDLLDVYVRIINNNTGPNGDPLIAAVCDCHACKLFGLSEDEQRSAKLALAEAMGMQSPGSHVYSSS
eukprot:TRINITY_DN108480_c0_g1_i1.p1 TRINITY_DN108480_c0_g1~~TRINITY_DN108480_c0_g1_i1.p1  ORF type:complete len:408 (+),score=43.61 TRINITY_DN108480_c0_g1_i1:78-1301(+)